MSCPFLANGAGGAVGEFIFNQSPSFSPLSAAPTGLYRVLFFFFYRVFPLPCEIVGADRYATATLDDSRIVTVDLGKRRTADKNGGKKKE